uniref:Uncharacterized protein n=1 Tax=Tanacetum cinerariifolium TaxID=118510 RepID=A0A6L2KHV2_TANCI|nr:hypothetical protein [Tanacetum cinerariifolium]
MVSNAIFAFIEKFLHHDFENTDQVMNIDLRKYKGKEGDFRRMFAAKGCIDPGGVSTAIRVLLADVSLGVSRDAVGVERELHEDDFVSNEEQVDGEENLKFNSNKEGFI